MATSPGNPFGTTRETLVRLRRIGNAVIINADDLVATHPHFRDAPTFTDALKAYRELKPAANRARDAAFEAALLEQPANQYETVAFTAGGPGSGKSTLSGAMQSEHLRLIYDTILGNTSSARLRINQVIESGRCVVIRYVHRNFEDAVRGNFLRALTQRRLATATEMAKAHRDARQAIEELLVIDAGRPKVAVETWENGVDGYRQITAHELRELPRQRVDELAQHAQIAAHAIYQGHDQAWIGPQLHEEVYKAFTE